MHIINSVNFTKLQNADIKGHKQLFFLNCKHNVLQPGQRSKSYL